MIPIPAVRTIGTAISYDGTQVTIHQPGTYLFIWTLLVSGQSQDEDGNSQGGDSGADVIVALESTSGVTRYALSGGVSEGQNQDQQGQDESGIAHVVGHTVVSLVAGDTLVLRNRSGADITLTAVGDQIQYSASLTIIRT